MRGAIRLGKAGPKNYRIRHIYGSSYLLTRVPTIHVLLDYPIEDDRQIEIAFFFARLDQASDAFQFTAHTAHYRTLHHHLLLSLSLFRMRER